MSRLRIEADGPEQIEDIINTLSKVFILNNINACADNSVVLDIEKKNIKTGRKRKFTEQEEETIKMYRYQGKSLNEIAEMFNCCRTTIHTITKGV